MRIGIIGGGAAGVFTAKKLCEILPSAAIVLFDAENAGGLYAKIRLPEYVSGGVERERLFLAPARDLAGAGIDFRSGVSVRSLDPANRAVTTSEGETLFFDRIVLATGATAGLPPCPGLADARNVYTLRTLADADALKNLARAGDPVLVLGGGLLGLEIAGSFRRIGMNVSVIECFDRLLPRDLTPEQSDALRGALPFSVHLSAKVDRVESDEESITLHWNGGEWASGRFLLVSAGIRPNIALAKASGIACGRGILVSDALETSAPGIYAAGDCAEQNGRGSGLWLAAKDQASALAEIFSGAREKFPWPEYHPVLKITGMNLSSILKR